MEKKGVGKGEGGMWRNGQTANPQLQAFDVGWWRGEKSMAGWGEERRVRMGRDGEGRKPKGVGVWWDRVGDGERRMGCLTRFPLARGSEFWFRGEGP